jgi:hypothetical protein
MSGKGDKWRKTDFKKFHENIDSIKFIKTKNKNVEVSKKKNKTTYKYN